MAWMDTKTDGVSTLPASEYNAMTNFTKRKAIGYMMYIDGSNYNLLNCSTGDITTSTVAADLIQSAVNAIGLTGGRIFFRNGTYNITHSIDVSGCIVTIEGENRYMTILQLADSANCNMFIIPATSLIQFPLALYNIWLYGNPLHNTLGSGIYQTNTGGDAICKNVTLHNCSIMSFPEYNIYTESTWGWKVYGCYLENGGIASIYIHRTSIGEGAFTNCKIAAQSTILLHIDGTVLGYDRFTACYFDQADHNAVLDESTHGQTIFTGCHIRDSGQEGIYINAPDDVITGCVFWLNSANTNNTYSDIKVGASGSNCIITGCNITGKGSSPQTKYGVEIIAGASNVQVNGNLITGQGTLGIIDGGTLSLIHHNRGWITEGWGTLTLPANATTVDVNHGCSAIPLSVICTPQQTNPAYWVTAVTSTKFTLNIGASTGVDRHWYWEAFV